MSDDNPYAPPMTDLTGFEDISGDALLADRGTRFVAAFIDGIIGVCYALPIVFVLGDWKYIAARQNIPFYLTAAGAVLGFIAFVLIHGYILKRYGQTIGKKLMGIRIADLDGNVPDYAKVLFLRYLPISVVSLIPGLGQFLPLIDVLFIFRADRRCIHDLLAGTKVVKVTKARTAIDTSELL